VIKLSEVLERASEELSRDCSKTPVTLTGPVVRALFGSLLDDVNAEFEMLRSLIRPASLEEQIAEREADRAELAKLEADEERDARFGDPADWLRLQEHISTFERDQLAECVEQVRSSDDPNAELAHLELLFGLPAIKLVRAALK
jgi:hypothetical protein